LKTSAGRGPSVSRKQAGAWAYDREHAYTAQVTGTCAAGAEAAKDSAKPVRAELIGLGSVN
jgi:hypothetical protein